METGVGFRQRGEALRRLPIEGAAIHHQTADHDAVAAQELRGRVHHEVRAELKRPAEPRRGEGGVDEERHGGGMGGRGDGGNVQHFKAGVAQRLAEHQLRVRPHCRGEGFRRARIDERRLDAKPRQRVFQEIVRTAVQGARRDDVIPRRADGGDGEMQRRLPAGHRDGTDAALQRAHALLQHGVGGIREARIHMAGTLDVEEPDRVVRIREHEGRALIDGRGTSAGGRIRRLPRVQRQGVEAGASGGAVLSVWHGLFGCERQRDGSRLGPAEGRGRSRRVPTREPSAIRPLGVAAAVQTPHGDRPAKLRSAITADVNASLGTVGGHRPTTRDDSSYPPSRTRVRASARSFAPTVRGHISTR